MFLNEIPFNFKAINLLTWLNFYVDPKPVGLIFVTCSIKSKEGKTSFKQV